MAKKKRRRGTPEGVDPNERRRERLEARRRAKAEAIAAQRRAQQRARLIRLTVYAGLFALAVWFFFFRGSDPPTQIAGHEIQSFTETGLNEHVDTPVTYEQSPPVSGPHAGAPADCGSYAEAVPNENLVHSLEHGAVALLYSPEAPVGDVRTLEEIAAENDENVLVAPYEGEMETIISAASWGRRMDLDQLDAAAVRGYIDEFAGKGPEAGQSCPNEQDQEFEPPEEEVAPGGGGGAPTPSPTP